MRQRGNSTKTEYISKVRTGAEDTDLEALALSQNKRFWKLIDDAIARAGKKGFFDLADLNAQWLPSDFPKRLRDQRSERVGRS